MPVGALFPGRYCIPFSFDDDQRERQRHDQLAVITRVLGALTEADVEWVSPEKKSELLAILPDNQWSIFSNEERRSKVASRLAEACPVALLGSPELELMHKMLEFNPAHRPAADAALQLPYFAGLAAEERPTLTVPPTCCGVEQRMPPQLIAGC